MKVAVVGGGIAGMSAAWHLAERGADVSLIETSSRIGGHTHTHLIEDSAGSIAVDTGFIVFNRAHYPDFSSWLDALQVTSQPTDMSFAVRDEIQCLEYGTGDFGGLLAHPGQLARPGYWRLWRDLTRFYRTGKPAPDAPDQSLGDYLDRLGYSAEFIDSHIVPMCAALWSQPAQASRELSVTHVLEFMHNHDMLRLHGRPEWRVIQGGSQVYVDAFIERFRGRVFTRCGAVKIQRTGDAVRVRQAGSWHRYDAAVIACHADEAMAVLTDITEQEASVLARFPFQQNRVYLHGDATHMPRRRLCWSSWNVLRDQSGGHTITYWMNRLQRLPGRKQFFVTLNPAAEPLNVVWRGSYAHPLFTREARLAQREWAALSSGAVTYAGAYWGAGFHEDGFVSGVRAADALLKRRRHAA